MLKKTTVQISGARISFNVAGPDQPSLRYPMQL